MLSICSCILWVFRSDFPGSQSIYSFPRDGDRCKLFAPISARRIGQTQVVPTNSVRSPSDLQCSWKGSRRNKNSLLRCHLSIWTDNLFYRGRKSRSGEFSWGSLLEQYIYQDNQSTLANRSWWVSAKTNKFYLEWPGPSSQQIGSRSISESGDSCLGWLVNHFVSGRRSYEQYIFWRFRDSEIAVFLKLSRFSMTFERSFCFVWSSSNTFYWSWRFPSFLSSVAPSSFF